MNISSDRQKRHTLDANRPLISVVVPCYNEEQVLRAFHQRLVAAVRTLAADLEIVYVDDGSEDRTAEILHELRAADERVRIVTLSRNFGHQIAVTAGIDRAAGDAVVIIDADLQDPPELIGEMYRCWQEGLHVVYGKRRERAGESAFKLGTAHLYYRLVNWVSEIPIPQDVGDFRLLDRRVVEVLKRMPEQERLLRGMVSWAGFRQQAIEYDRDPRYAGETKYSLLKMIGLAFNGVVSFSLKPIHFVLLLGVVLICAGAAMAAYRWFTWLVWPDAAEAIPLLIPAMAFFSGLQLLGLGIVGQYVGRIYRETQRRPLYVVNEECVDEGVLTNDIPISESTIEAL